MGEGRDLWRREETVDSSGARVMHSCNLLHVGAGS